MGSFSSISLITNVLLSTVKWLCLSMPGDATTTVCHRYTPHDQLRLFTQSADILVVATGIPGLITADMVKPDAVVIDVGINEVRDTKTGKWRVTGDVDFIGTHFLCLLIGWFVSSILEIVAGKFP